MKNLAQRYEPPANDCCTAAEGLIERIARMDNSRLDLAYLRLAELLECAQRRPRHDSIYRCLLTPIATGSARGTIPFHAANSFCHPEVERSGREESLSPQHPSG
jgi:hypothetical protein